MNRELRTAWIATLAPLLAAAAAAQLPLGPEQQINDYTTSFQGGSRVAATPDGGFVVAWISADPCDGPEDSNAYARRFLADGEPADSQFRVNQWCHGLVYEYPESVLVDEDGELTIVWTTSAFAGPFGWLSGGSARRFAPDGAPLGNQFVVAPTLQYAGRPVAGGSASGEFVVARSLLSGSNYVRVARFDTAGTEQWSFPIEAAAQHGVHFPAVSMEPKGHFVVAWEDTSGWLQLDDLRMRRFDVDGSPLGETVDVSEPGAAGSRGGLRLARNGAGSVLVAWRDDLGSSTQTFRARVFDTAGIPLGPQLQIGNADQYDSISVAAAQDGSFVLSWMDPQGGGTGDGSSAGIRASTVSASGEPLSSAFRVNSYTTGVQSSPSVAFLPDGDFVVAWTSDGSFGDDNSDSSVQLRRFRLAFFADGFESGDTSRWVFGED